MNTNYAGFWKRFCAAFIDGIITQIVAMIIAFIFGFMIGMSGGAIACRFNSWWDYWFWLTMDILCRHGIFWQAGDTRENGTWY